MASGQFTEGTKFCRSERLNSRNEKVYWYVDCPDCGSTGESTSSGLQKGCRPCLCTRSRQQEGYINWIVDTTDQAVALKFGVANVTKRRVTEQNKRGDYEIRNYLIYKFPNKLSCFAAERECKKTLDCGVLTYEQMPDGWTETTDILNLVRIKSIYEKHGGIRQ
ncbi:hypothetical protein D3C80_1645600 [compost metagenome]